MNRKKNDDGKPRAVETIYKDSELRETNEGDHSEVFHAEILPLVKQITELCRQHGILLVAGFQLQKEVIN